MHSQIATMDHEHVSAKITLKHQQNDIEVSGHGNGPVDAAANAMADKLGLFVNIIDYHEHGLGSGANAEAICYVEMSIADMTIFGVAQDPNIMTAAVKALINGVNQFLNQTTRDQVVNQ